LPVHTTGILSCGHQNFKEFAMHPTRNDLPARNRARLEKWLNDAGTSGKFTAVSRDVDKHLWFLEAHLQASR
jgi:DNA-binding ferritin-like protein